MKVKAGVNFHNRFDIVKNGEWVGYAENIILDQMYNRICNFSTYFVNIHFGTGSGTPTPDRTSLFNHLGTKTATTEEIILALPVGSVTKGITLSPSEYVGSTITEVGIAFGSASTSLVTHAMIKDSEGNPLAIEKTDLDVVVIYATVFVSISDSQFIKFAKTQFHYPPILEYLLTSRNTLSSDQSIYFSNTPSDFRGKYFSSNFFQKSAIRTVDVPNKKVSFYNRLEIDEGNKDIYSISTSLGFRVIYPHPELVVPPRSDIRIGTGDGATTRFRIPNNSPSNIAIKVDGIISSDYNLDSLSKELPVICHSTVLDSGAVQDDNFFGIGTLSGKFYMLLMRSIIFYVYELIEGDAELLSVYETTAPYVSSPEVRFGTKSGEEALYIRGRWSSTVSEGTQHFKVLPDGTVERGVSTSGVEWGSNQAYLAGYVVGPYKTRDRKSPLFSFPNILVDVVFNTPPANGAVITASYDTGCIPKDENYVLDTTLELQFGEGV